MGLGLGPHAPAHRHLERPAAGRLHGRAPGQGASAPAARCWKRLHHRARDGREHRQRPHQPDLRHDSHRAGWRSRWQQSARVGPDGAAVFELPIEDPQLWWPNGYGEQPLYDVAVSLINAGDASLDRNDFRMGLRTIELRQEPDQWGKSWQFVVNGVADLRQGIELDPGGFVPDAHQRRISRRADPVGGGVAPEHAARMGRRAVRGRAVLRPVRPVRHPRVAGVRVLVQHLPAG